MIISSLSVVPTSSQAGGGGHAGQAAQQDRVQPRIRLRLVEDQLRAADVAELLNRLHPLVPALRADAGHEDDRLAVLVGRERRHVADAVVRTWQEAFDDMRTDGTLQRIRREWNAKLEDSPFPEIETTP